MKTTVDLPDELLVRAKKRAAEERRPLRSLMEEGLRRVLRPRREIRSNNRRRKMRWVTVNGGLPPGLNLTDRAKMHEWIRGHR